MHLWSDGTGIPVVVLPCLGEPAIGWRHVQLALRDDAALFLVDRPGLGWSDARPWWQAATMDRMERELAAALKASGVPSPYVLVGHSTGGVSARLHAARHRSEVGALVLFDSSHEDQHHRLPAERGPSPRQQAIRIACTPLGLTRLAAAVGSRNREEGAAGAVTLTRGCRRADAQELWSWPGEARRGHLRREARDLGDLPVTVVTGGPSGRADWWPVWVELQDDLASYSSNTTRVAAHHVGHHIHRDDPDVAVRIIRDTARGLTLSRDDR